MHPELLSPHMRGFPSQIFPELESPQDGKLMDSRMLVVDFDSGAVSVHSRCSSGTPKLNWDW